MFPVPNISAILNKYDKLIADIDIEHGLWIELQTLLQRGKNYISSIYVVPYSVSSLKWTKIGQWLNAKQLELWTLLSHYCQSCVYLIVTVAI